MAASTSVVSMRLPADSQRRLKRLARRYGWTASDASARLVEEGLRRSEFAYIDFRDSTAGRQACIQGSTLAVWEVIMLIDSYKGDKEAVTRHLGWSKPKVEAAFQYASAYPEEIDCALSEQREAGLTTLKRMLPQTTEFTAEKKAKRNRAQASA
jgi:uncharacterized protein (DUF433 family)